MPTTPALALPYPAPTDAADGPVDFQELAERTEALLLGSSPAAAAGWTVGDLKLSAQTGDHGRWLLSDGRALTQANIESALGLAAGQALALVTLLGTGASSKYGAAGTGEVRLPDPRGRALLGAGTGSGLTARAVGAAGGAEAVTLTAAQSGVRDHQHEAGTLTAASHWHQTYNTGGPTSTRLVTYGQGTLTVVATEDHYHGAGNGYKTGNTAPDVTGSVNQATTNHHASNGDAAEQSHANMPPFLALGNVFIRV